MAIHKQYHCATEMRKRDGLKAGERQFKGIIILN